MSQTSNAPFNFMVSTLENIHVLKEACIWMCTKPFRFSKTMDTIKVSINKGMAE